ncbi:hypothetical protein ACQCSV_03240 [Pseudarthrobacter sp. S3]|uniref:hypothetical protein n=1 Tax=Pseudarthrobacter sp. S3 TaxID=3418419 RepID=UPI00339A9810
MSEEVTGSAVANEGVEGAAENVKEVAGDAAENVKELASDLTENVKGFGAKIAGLFKGGK